MMTYIFILIISLAAFANPREEAEIVLSKFQTVETVSTRLDLFSQSFLNVPYGNGGPLGEGELGRYDQDPLYRFDAFDCTTFVETVVSLSLAREVTTFESTMDEIRYENGEIDYLKRNHFPSLQWIPNNIKNGLLKEINQLIVPTSDMKLAEAVINLPGWLKAIKIEEIRVPLATLEERTNLLEELRSYSTQYSPTVARLAYIPIPTLIAKSHILKKIPHGSIVNFVRPNWDLTDVIGTHMNVSHQGFIFQTRAGTILRHASTTGKVMEVPLIEYLKKFENHPTMKGIHLMQLN
jgi:hypothetical protein